MFAALGASLVFTFVIATLAAKSKRAEIVIVPALDILQSVPILGFLTFTVTFFMGLFPGQQLGVELAAIFAIFTSQAWNMAFSFYQSLRSVPGDLEEVSRGFALSPWRRFIRLELPFATPSLVWNAMMSMSGGWFFIVAAEAISVGNTRIMLPGIGSWLALAIDRQDFRAVGWAVGAMAVVILLYDQFVFRPVVAWADRFRFEQTASLSAVYTADVRSDIAGGIARGTRYLDNLDLQVAVDADRLVGWHGARLFAYAIYDNGTNFSSNLVGDTQSVSNIETGVRTARLFEAWVEQDVGRNASLKAGLYNLNSEFDTTQSGGFFLLSSHGIGPDISQSGRNGPLIFPVTSLAVRAEGNLGTHWLARVAVLDGVPGDPAHPAATAIKLSARDGALVVGEVNYLSGGTKAAVGAWGYFARFDAIPLGGAPASGRGNAGAYAFVEHRMKGTRANDADGLAGWLRFGIADTRYNPIARYLGGGLVYTGTFKGRENDQIGLSLAVAEFGDRYRRSQALAGTAIGRRETVIEAGYMATLASWLRIQPDIQYVLRPGGDAGVGDAVIVGFRIKVGK